MNEKWMRDLMDDVRLTDEKKRELWDGITKKANHRRYLKRRITAAAAIFILLMIPGAVYAASAFEWKWSPEETKNTELDENFKTEHGSLTVEGFRFDVKKAFIDASVGTAFIYVGVTDVSGQGRNPNDYYAGSSDIEKLNAGDITFDMDMERASGMCDEYDKENSTETTAYYYLDADLHDRDSYPGNASPPHPDLRPLNRLEIRVSRITKVTKEENSPDGVAGTLGEMLAIETIEIQNVIAMPSLIWEIDRGDTTEVVRVSSIAAHLKETNNCHLDIVLKNGKEIKEGTSGDYELGDFVSKTCGTEPGSIYRFEYTDIDQISGIRLNGTFYPVSEARRSDE